MTEGDRRDGAVTLRCSTLRAVAIRPYLAAEAKRDLDIRDRCSAELVDVPILYVLSRDEPRTIYSTLIIPLLPLVKFALASEEQKGRT